jgi:hypothetical protein
MQQDMLYNFVGNFLFFDKKSKEHDVKGHFWMINRHAMEISNDEKFYA